METETELLARIKKDVLFGHDISPPSVDPDKCTGCGRCVKVCTALVFEVREQTSHVVNGTKCIACGHCWAVCPEGAVTQAEVAAAVDTPREATPPVRPEDLQVLFRARRSVRLFTDEPVTREQLLAVVEAGRYVPTGTNRQDVSYTVLTDPDSVSRLRAVVEGLLDGMAKALDNRVTSFFFRLRMGRLMRDQLRWYALGFRAWSKIPVETRQRMAYFPLPYGPAVIVAHAQSFEGTAIVSCSLALHQSSLMAGSMGLGTCFLGFVPVAVNRDKKAREWLGIPEENQVYAALVVGHPAVEYRRLVERRARAVKWL